MSDLVARSASKARFVRCASLSVFGTKAIAFEILSFSVPDFLFITVAWHSRIGISHAEKPYLSWIKAIFFGWNGVLTASAMTPRYHRVQAP